MFVIRINMIIIVYKFERHMMFPLNNYGIKKYKSRKTYKQKTGETKIIIIV